MDKKTKELKKLENPERLPILQRLKRSIRH